MSDFGIETLGLTKEFKSGILAVDSIELKIPKGKIFGFLGPNGAGKSTTINMLATILPVTKGTAKIFRV